MKSVLSAALLSFALLIAPSAHATEPPAPTPMIELDKSSKGLSKYKSLHKKLDQLRAQFEKGDGRRMIGTIKSARRELENAVKRDDTLDLSAEAAEIDAYDALAQELVALAAAAKNRDRALKTFDKEAARLEKMIEQAARSKPRPDQFTKSFDKATEALGTAAEADPSFDLTDQQAQLDGMPDRYAAAQVTYSQAGQFKLINKEIAALTQTVDRIKLPTRTNSQLTKKLEAGESFLPEKIATDRADVLAAFDTAKTETPDIDLSAPQAELATLDARIAEIEPQYIQAGIDVYFADQFEDVEGEIKSLKDGLAAGYAADDAGLQRRQAEITAVNTRLDQSKTAYPSSDFTALDARLTAMSKDFDASTKNNAALVETNAYFEKTYSALQHLGRIEMSSLQYSYADILDGGIEKLNVGTLRQRVSERGEAISPVYGSGTEQFLAKIDFAMTGTGYANGIRDILKQTNNADKPLNDRTANADAAVRLAMLGERFQPEDPRYPKLTKEAELRQAALLEEKRSRFASASTGDFHLQNMDSVVFHTAPLVPGTEDTSLVTNRFNAGEPIYGTAYLSLPLREASLNTSRPESVEIETFFGDRLCRPYGSGRIMGLTREDGGKTAISFALLPTLDGYTFQDRNDLHVNFAKCLGLNATVGEQRVNVTLDIRDPNGSSEYAKLKSGFTLVYDADSRAQITPIVAELEEMRIDAARMPAAKLNDESLEAILLQAAEFVDGEPLRAVLSTERWVVYKNDFDIPVNRELRGHIAVKTAEDRCFVYGADLGSKYIGAAYSTPRAERIRPEKFEIRCENVDS